MILMVQRTIGRKQKDKFLTHPFINRANNVYKIYLRRTKM
jgi:hypothetical protein